MNNAVEVQGTPTGVVKIEVAIRAGTQRLADAEASLEQARARRKRALVADDGAGEFQKRRKAALANGDDGEVDVLDQTISAAVDKIDGEIAAAQKFVTRERDRLQVLEEDLAEAKALEQQRSMDAVFNRADAARKIGEALIRNEYAEWSAKGLTILSTLVAIETFIRESNTILDGGRTGGAPVDTLKRRVAGANNIRRIADQVIPATTREVEYQEQAGWFDGHCTPYVTKTRIEDVPEKRILGSWQPELFEGCVIVPVMPGDAEWDKHGRAKAEAEMRHEEIIASLLGEI